MISLFAGAGVLLTGVYLVGLAATSLTAPGRAARFLLGFAGSARAHYVELLVRLAAGAAFVAHAPHMLVPTVFSVFGWLLIITTLGLLFVPWRWHRRFAQRAVPHAVRHLRLVGVASLALGGFVLAALLP